MTNSAASQSIDIRRPISIGRFSLTAALSLFIVYVVCWAAAAVGIPLAHTFITLFTSFEPSSFAALCVGGAWALLAGAFVGAVIAVTYSLVSFVEPASANSGNRLD